MTKEQVNMRKGTLFLRNTDGHSSRVTVVALDQCVYTYPPLIAILVNFKNVGTRTYLCLLDKVH